MTTSEGYTDIVWRQFRKNRPALAALWVLVPMLLLAIFAPVIASGQPLVVFEQGRAFSPWVLALFNTSETVDYLFNMALVAFVPWLAVVLPANYFARRRGVPGRIRLLSALSLYMLATLTLSSICAWSQFHPRDAYRTRNFAEEEFSDAKSLHGWYTLLPFDASDTDLASRYKSPGFAKTKTEERASVNDGTRHWLGADDMGHDVLVRMIYGTRISLTVGFVAVGIYLTIGVVVGALAGYFGGWIDILLSRVIEVVMLFPTFFLILTIVALSGPSIYIIMVVIGFTGWAGIARLIRGEVLKQRSMDYVTAARALGASNMRIIFRHILVNALTPALVAAPFGVAEAIIIEAELSLLGFGVPPPAPSWGALLEQGKDNYSYWWLIVVPSVAIFVTVTAFNLVGSGLRDAMDPRLRK